MSNTTTMVIDKMNLGINDVENLYRCEFCGHVTDLHESEGEIWHWGNCVCITETPGGDFTGASDEYGFANDR